MQALTPSLLHDLEKGRTFAVSDTGHLKRITWRQYCVRWLNWSEAGRQDREVSDWLRKCLHQTYSHHGPDSTSYPKVVEAIAKYIKFHQTDQRLANTLFAHKCCLLLPSLKLTELINEDGTAAHQLLSFLKQNSLHYIISKNLENKDTALLIHGKEIYIRSKQGTDFLKTPESIDLILSRITAEHPDTPLLKELQTLLGKKNFDLANHTRVEEIRQQLELSHYTYQSLKDIQTDHKGRMIAKAYLYQGIADFDCNWSDLKPSFYQKSDTGQYTLHVITRLPKYALEKTWFKTILVFLRHLLDFRAHGHSWIEMSQPLYHANGTYTGYVKKYVVGYYFHVLDRYKRLEAPDPMTFMPSPSEHTLSEEVIISKAEFEKGKLYIEKVQALLKNFKNHIHGPLQDPSLSETDIQDIQFLFESSFISTCVCFANTLKGLLTGIKKDSRHAFLRFLFPKTESKKSNFHFNAFNHTIFVLFHWFVSIPRFVFRMELPFWHKKEAFTTPTKND